MGISSEIQLFLKEDNQSIEIYPLESETSAETEPFSVEYLFSHLISEEICNTKIDISKITVLELSKCNLTEVPLSCNKLNLNHLGLSHNYLDHVPLCLYNGLKHLGSLDLSHNRIQNFDLEPDCLLYIKKVKLNNNKFDNVPKWLLMFRCTNLEEFNYSHNKAKNYNFMKNSFNLNLFKLKKLELVNTRLIDDDYSLLKSFRQLEYLDISNAESNYMNKFEDLDGLFIKPKWIGLKVLKICGLNLSICPEGIAWLESLKELHVNDNCLSWLPNGLEFLVNLEVLVVSNNNLISLPKCLSSIEQLTILRASNNNLEVVPDFSSMPNLKVLDLFDNALDEVSFNIENIDFVDVEYNYCDTSEFQNYSLYEKKKSKLRSKYSVHERWNQVKIRPPDDSVDTCSKSDLHYYDQEVSSAINYICYTEDDEDWDLPLEPGKILSDIDSEDNRWQGEDIKPRLRDTCNDQRVYVSDDDWMFADCSES